MQDSQSKTHHLLDASFPSFNNKARGLTLTCSWKDQFSDPGFHFREMCVWEQVVRAVPVDFAAELKKAAEKRSKRMAKKGPRKVKVRRQKPKASPKRVEDPNDVDDLEDNRPQRGGGSKEEGKHSTNSKPVSRKSSKKEVVPESDSEDSEDEEPKKKTSIDVDVHAARNPHFVAKIDLPDRLKHLRKSVGPAPWDATGKPLLFSKK